MLKSTCISCSFFFMYCVPLSSSVMYYSYHLKKSNFAQEKEKKLLQFSVLFGSASLWCFVLFQAAVGCGSTNHGHVLGAQAKSKSGLAPPVRGIVL